ncbi:MAG: quinolinate synthase NadA [Ruminococcaceae bacterium]|nr:quinolinate synthase NadA [Oscillospiraceae bacterium]
MTDISDKQALIDEILKLKKEKDAIILAHSYQTANIQNIADVVGDSYALSKYCTKIKEKTIVFCGVHFMAESAKILSPEKTVLLPEKDAGCPMADMVSAPELRAFKEMYPDAAVVTYINSSAAVKAESDVIVTSSNAVKVVKNMKEKQIIFCPDKNLGSFVAEKCPDKEFILWDGYCPVHNKMTKEDIMSAKEKYPFAKILIHPECPSEVCENADFIGSTKDIMEFAAASEHKEFIVGTEKGVIYPMSRDNNDKKFYLLSENLVCEDMKLTTLESLYKCLSTGEHEMDLDEEIIEKASKALNRMIDLASK